MVTVCKIYRYEFYRINTQQVVLLEHTPPQGVQWTHLWQVSKSTERSPLAEHLIFWLLMSVGSVPRLPWKELHLHLLWTRATHTHAATKHWMDEAWERGAISTTEQSETLDENGSLQALVYTVSDQQERCSCRYKAGHSSSLGEDRSRVAEFSSRTSYNGWRARQTTTISGVRLSFCFVQASLQSIGSSSLIPKATLQ